MNTRLRNLRTAYGTLLDIEGPLWDVKDSDLSQIFYDAAKEAMARSRVILESLLGAPADAGERRAQLMAAIELDGVNSPLVARAARLFADAADEVFPEED